MLRPERRPDIGTRGDAQLSLRSGVLPLDSLPSITFDLKEERSAERYAPLIANRFREMDPQIAMFSRGDSVHVVAAYDVSNEKDLDSSGVQSALVVAPDEKTPSVIVSRPGAQGTFTFNTDSAAPGAQRRDAELGH